MKLYTADGIPNPRIVDVAMYEKNLNLERIIVDFLEGENRASSFLAKNPAGQIPVLELDDGTIISEVTAIIEYFEEVCPDPFLVGATAKERAEARMWARRVDLAVMEPMSMAFKYGIGKNYFEKRITVYPEAAESMKNKAQDGLVWLDNVLAGKQFLCGDRMTYGDIMLYCYTDYFKKTGQKVESGLVHLTHVLDSIAERPSVQKTV